MLPDMLEQHVVFAILDAQDLNMLKRFEG